ncbi:MAG: double zinc ribbon domain-containing protein [Candidatus Puniceispirillales bacterium]
MKAWQNLIRLGVNVLIPPQCPGCHMILYDDGLCGECWSRIKRITPPLCMQCGRGFPFAAGLERCGRCLTQPPDYDRAIAGFGYNAMSRQLILGLKYAKRHDVTPVIARMMANAGAELLHDADWIIPLPLHWTRYFHRGFNQSAELTHAIMKTARIPSEKYRPDLLKRIKKT